VLRAPRVVGRERERGLLERAVSRQAGRAGSAMVIGPAGSGKSSLVRAVFPDAERLLVGRAAPSSENGMTPIIELAVGLVDLGARFDESALGVFGPAAAALLPGLSSSADGVRAEVPHPVVLADTLVRLWATLPVPRRPVLVLEDLHWAGEASWAVAARLLRKAGKVGAGVVGTSRPEGRWWPELARGIRSGDLIGVELEALPSDAVAELVAECLALEVDAVPPGLLHLTDAAGGLPLMIEEVLSDLEHSGQLIADGGHWLWRPRAGVMPRSLAAATRERVSALPREQARLVERAALLGAAPSLELLFASLGTKASHASTAIRAAVEVGLLHVDPATGRAEFRHELVRDAVLASVLEPDRRAHAAALLTALVGGAADDASDVVAAAQRLDDESLALAARLAAEAGLATATGPLHLACARRLLRRGLPLPAAETARVAAGDVAVRAEALATEVQALALAGEVDRALASAARLDALPGAGLEQAETWADTRAGVREAVARALAARGDWEHAERRLVALRGPDEPASTTALAALIALERGFLEDAEAWATRSLERSTGGPEECQALEVLGRIARGHDLDRAQHRFRQCVAVAEARDLVVWRARALHEDATIEQLRTLSVEPLHLARQAAVDAGAPGLVSAVDFHLAAVLGVRFESEPALHVARGLLADAREQGATRLEAWAWVLIGQAHAVGGRRTHAEAATTQAMALAPQDAEIEGVAIGVGRALPAMLADQSQVALGHWKSAVDALRRLPSMTPLPPWYLWPVVATVADADGDGGARARAEAASSQLRVIPGVDAIRYLAEAVAAGRAGDAAEAEAAAASAAVRFGQMPAFVGWRHLAHRSVAADAMAAGWGDPAAWMTEAAAWFAAAGFTAPAAACRGLARRAGAPQRRRGRGDAQVPPHLERLGVTSREVDILLLVAEGLTNADIAARLYLSPRTVKGYVEQLLAKTGATNRTQLASRLADRAGDRPTSAP